MRRPLPQRGRYPTVGSIATHRSYRFVWCLRRLFGCKYHRRVSLLSFQISRPVGLVPSQDSNAGGLPVGLLWLLGRFTEEVRNLKFFVWFHDLWDVEAHFVVQVSDQGVGADQIIIEDTGVFEA